MDKGRLKEYFYSNFASVFWSSFLLLGGGIFIIYYARIGYMPDFDLKSSVTITAAAAVTAVVITAILLSMMVLPGAFWGEVWSQLGAKSKIKKYWAECGPEATFFRLLVWFAMPLVSIYIGLFLYFFIEWFSLFFPVMVFFGLLFYLVRKSGFGFWESLKEWGFLFFANVVSAILLFLPLSLVYKLSVQQDHYLDFPSWFAAFLAAIFIVFTNVASAAPQEKASPILKNLILGSVALFVVLWVFGKFDRIPVSVMSIYKFGNIEADELVLSEEGCELFQSLDINVSITDYNACIVDDVLILSRLGREAYLEVDQNDSEVLKLTLASSSIISWVLRESH